MPADSPPTTAERPATAPTRWVLAASFVAALISALLFSSQIYVSMVDHGHDWWRLFGWQMVCWGFWAAVAPWVLRIGAQLLRPRDRPPLWPLRVVGTALGLIATHVFIGAGALVLFQPYVPVATYTLVESLERIADSWLQVDPLIFLILLAIGYGFGGLLLARRRELRQSRLEAQLANARLDALQLEIQPHFIFNTLNAIAAQVRLGANNEALEMILGLGELLRSTLDRSGAPLVPLREELDFLRRYLELQRLRFADRLDIGYTIDETCLDAAVPFLLLQPLAENAVNHGIGRRAGECEIEIRATREGDRLTLSVLDDGGGLDPDFDVVSSPGVGLSNTRSKLSQIYNGAASLDIRNREPRGVEVVVTLPLEDAPPAEGG